MKFQPRAFLLVTTIAATVGYVVSLWSGWNVWACIGVSVLAAVLNSIVLSIEDNQPGGLNHPE